MKTLLISLIVVLVLLVTAILVGPSIVDWQAHKQWVEARLSGLLGEPVRISGDLDFSMLPTPSLTASGVSVGTAMGPDAPAALEVSALDMRVSLLPLLTGRLEIERIVLVEPTFHARAQADGTVDWLGRHLFDGTNDGRRLSLGRLTVDNGFIDYRDEATGEQRSLDDVFVQISADSLRGPASLIGSVSFDGIAYTLDVSSGRVTGNGSVPLTIGIGVDGLDGELRFSGLLLPAGELHGDLSVSGSDVAAAVRRFVPDVEGLPAPVQRFALRGQMRASAQSIALDPMTLELNDARGIGKMTAVLEPEPSITASIDFNRLDLDVWTEGLALSDAMDGWLANGDFALPRDFDLALALSAEAANFRGSLVRQLKLTGSLLDGNVTVDRFSASLPGGSDLALVATVRAEDGLPWGNLAVEAASGDLRDVLEWLGADLTSIPASRLRSFAGGFSFTGTPREFQASAVDLTIDNSHIDGSVAFRQSQRRGLGLRLNVDRLNLDAYHQDGARGYLPNPFDDAEARRALLDLIDDYDANLQIEIGDITVNDIAIGSLDLDATVVAGSVVLNRAQITSLASTDVSAEGRIGALDPVAGVDLTVAADSGDPTGFLTALGIDAPHFVEPLDEAQVSGRLQGGADVLVVDLQGTFPGGTVNIGGSVEQAFAEPVYDVSARLRHDDGQRMVQYFMPSFQPRGPIGPVDLYARVLGTAALLRLDELQGTIGDMPLAGTVDIDRSGEKPTIDAELRAGTIELDRYLPPPRATVLSGGFVSRWGPLTLDPEPLEAIDGSLALTATALRIGDLTLDDPTLRATLGNGTLSLSPLTGRLLGGHFGLRGTIAPGGPPQLSFEVDLVGADLAPGLRSLFDLEGLAGTFDFGIDAAAQGNTIGAMIGSMSGQGLLAIREGVIAGIDLAQIDAGLTEASEPLDFLDRLREALRDGETTFAAINVPFQVDAGIAHTDALRAAGDTGFAEGRGMLDLAGESLDISTEFYLHHHPDAPPFVIQLMGPLANPVQRPQTQALQAYFAHKAAEALAERFGVPPEPDGDGTPAENPDRPLPNGPR